MKRITLFKRGLPIVLASLSVVISLGSTSHELSINASAETQEATTQTVLAEETDTDYVEQEEYQTVFSYKDILHIYYEGIVEHCETSKVEIDESVTLDAFYDSYYEQNIYLISEYVEYLKTVVDNKGQLGGKLTISDLSVNAGIMVTSGSGDWWENIDISKDLPQKPNYDNWLYELKVGDIIYEEGVDVTDFEIVPDFIGIETGHIGIVEGSVSGNYNSQSIQYWRIVESVKPTGVVYSVIDNNRFVENKTIVLRVSGATNTQCKNAVNFCKNEIGKEYLLTVQKKESSDKWSCSTLLWAAYKSAGIDICAETSFAYPIDIYNSSATYTVSFIEYDYLKFEIVGKHPFLLVYNSWDVIIKNPNSININGFYNAKMCNDTHALKFDEANLTDETALYIAKNGSKQVYIEHNGTATHITACYHITVAGTNYKVVTAADNLKYSNSQGSCKMYYSLVMVS